MSEKVNSAQSVQDQCGASVILAAASVIVGNSTLSHIVLHRNSSPLFLVHVFWQTFGFSKRSKRFVVSSQRLTAIISVNTFNMFNHHLI